MTFEPTIRVAVDPTNPGQFFACCGLLELADRLWNGAEGWFELSSGLFNVHSAGSEALTEHFLTRLRQCELSNTMHETDLHRYAQLKGMKKKDMSVAEELERKAFDKQWRELPLRLGTPFRIELNWFLDSQYGGSRFKTWAGQQSVIEIATSMKTPVTEGLYDSVNPLDWLREFCGSLVTFNFDSDVSAQSSGLDVGFVLDPLGMGSASRPLLELLAFVGLQRFRPQADPSANAYTYACWQQPLLPGSAAAAAAGVLHLPRSQRFRFPLLYRTKYLKSFLPAQPIGEPQ